MEELLNQENNQSESAENTALNQDQPSTDEAKESNQDSQLQSQSDQQNQEIDMSDSEINSESELGVAVDDNLALQSDGVAEQQQVSEDVVTPIVKGEPKWYIVQTLTGQEDKVKLRLEQTIEELGLKEKILRVLVPEEETVEIRGEKRIERKRKMYPGYVFVEMILDEDTWYKIRSTAGVARFIGSKTSPVPVTDREMQRVLKQLGIKEKEINVEFVVGEPIRIISGSFRGYTGSVAEVNPAKSKIKAMINIFGRDTSVEVDFDRVEKVI